MALCIKKSIHHTLKSFKYNVLFLHRQILMSAHRHRRMRVWTATVSTHHLAATPATVTGATRDCFAVCILRLNRAENIPKSCNFTLHYTATQYINKWPSSCISFLDTDDLCASNPCRFGDCLNGPNAYTCNCNSGYEGRLCDIRT